VWPPYKRWLSEPPSLPTQLIHSHFSDENPSHSWAPASGYRLLPSIWLLFTNTLFVPRLSPTTSDSDHHFPLPLFSWSVSTQCLWPHLPNFLHSSPISLMPGTSTILQTPPGLHQHPLLFLLWIHKLLAVPSPHISLNPLFPALHFTWAHEEHQCFLLSFLSLSFPLCFLFLTCISLSPRSSWMYHLSPGVPVVVPCEENTTLSSFFPLLLHLRILAQLERRNKHMWWHICGLQLDADLCSLSQPYKNHFTLPRVSSMPWLAVLPTTFYRWLKSEFTREQWPSDQQLSDFLTSLSQGLYVSQAFLSILVGGETSTSDEGCSLHLYPVPISSCWSVAFSLLQSPCISEDKLHRANME